LAQSLEELVRRSGDLLKEVDWNDLLALVGGIVEGTGTAHVDPGESLPDAIERLPAGGGEVCLAAGTHELGAPLVLRGRARVALTGAGPSTIVRAPASEAAVVLDGCREVTLARLRVEGGTPPTPEVAAHINGAVTVLGGTDVTLSDCTLACPDAAPRAQSCLTARAATGGAQAERLRIERCRLEIGAGQTGALLIDPATATVERSQAFLRPGAPGGSGADAGILVAGANVGTVRVLDNVVQDAARGIHVGISRRGVTPTPAAEIVVISGNVVHVFIPAGYTRDRHAVFVGNARSISILDTVATLRRAPQRAEGPILPVRPVEAIRVYGSFGPYLLVRGSSLRGFNVGVRVVPLASPSTATWVVTDTLAEGAAQGVDAPPTVEQERNRPAQVIRKPGTPARVLLTPAVSSGARGTKQRITATVVDIAGLRVPSVTVRFAVTGANTIAESGLTTDQNGEAAFEYTGANAGTDTVRAYADIDRDGVQDVGEPFAFASHNNVAPDPAAITLDRTVIAATTGQLVTVKATVRDAAAAPLPNIDVHFLVTGANQRADTIVKTDAAGVAAFSYTGGNQGTDVVTVFATSAAGERRTTATVTYLLPVPARLTLSPAQGFEFRGGSITLTATVFDPAGAVRPETVVRFRVTGANATSSAATTDAKGEAKLTYTGTNAGTDQVTAFADVNNNGQQDVSDPFAVAAVTFSIREADRVLVPDLEGMTRLGAENTLRDAGLALGRVTIAPVPRTGILLVVAQDPAAGVLVNPGSAVNIGMRRELIDEFERFERFRDVDVP
jgi:hypothetical protein